MAKLTEQERQEAIRIIEAGKPVPNKYRLLLLDDKPEVELVWNCETNQTTSVALPFQVIEQVAERASMKTIPKRGLLQADATCQSNPYRVPKGISS